MTHHFPYVSVICKNHNVCYKSVFQMISATFRTSQHLTNSLRKVIIQHRPHRMTHLVVEAMAEVVCH